MLKDPRDVTANGFNRFDPKYISIGPKAIRGSVTLSTAINQQNKCATLRHGGRYGGSLSGGFHKGSPNPNIKNPQPPSISTVSNEYQTSRAPQSSLYGVGGNVNHNMGVDISGGFSKKESSFKTDQQPPLPKSSVYSIDTSYNQQMRHTSNTKDNIQNSHSHQHQMMQNSGVVNSSSGHQPMQQQLPTKGISIVNQPLPEIPQQQQTLKMPDVNKNMQQPLCVSNLNQNQYRSLQRPSNKQSTVVSIATATTYQQQNSTKNIQAKEMSKPSIAQPPKVNPPSLPPKNRHKDDTNRNRQYNTGTLPTTSKSQNLNQYYNNNNNSCSTSILKNQSAYSTFGYEKGQNSSSVDGGGSGMSTFDRHPGKSLTRGGTEYQYDHGGSNYNNKMSNLAKQSYQTLPHQSRNDRQSSNTTSFGSGNKSSRGDRDRSGESSSGDRRSHKNEKNRNFNDDPNAYFRSLQRGGGTNTTTNSAAKSQVNNDLYSVTEL